MSRKGKPIVRRRTAPSSTTDHSINLTLHEALEYVYTYKQSEGLRERTLKGYREVFGYFMEWITGYHPEVERVNDVTSGLIREYIVYLSEEKFNVRTGEYGLSPYTVNVRVRLLKSMFHVLHTEEIINNNPVVGVKLLKVDEDSFEPLTEDEINRLLKVPDVTQYAQFRDLVAMYLILDTGIRSSELFNLKMAHVDFKSRCLVLPGSITKNRKPRILPLSNQVLKLVMELVTEVKTNFDTEYVFVSNFGEQYQPNSFRRRILTYKERAGIEKPSKRTCFTPSVLSRLYLKRRGSIHVAKNRRARGHHNDKKVYTIHNRRYKEATRLIQSHRKVTDQISKINKKKRTGHE